MRQSPTLTVDLSVETEAKLARLAGITKRATSVLAGEAIAAHVDRELAVIDAVETGRADVRAGRVYDAELVFRDADAVIAEVEAAQARR